jgi:anti-anti-sigma regulatory factor
LNELVAEGEYHLVVDMAGVDFLDSTGLGVLVGGLKRTRAHEGTLQLVCDQEKILKVFRITGLTKVFPIHSTLNEALSSASSPSAATPAAGNGLSEGRPLDGQSPDHRLDDDRFDEGPLDEGLLRESRSSGSPRSNGSNGQSKGEPTTGSA